MVTPAEPPAPPALRARGIRVVAGGGRSGALRRRRVARALEGFSVDLAAGEVVHLVGDRASGIAEALEVLSGQRVPEAGRLAIEGREVPRPGRRARELWARVALLGDPPADASGRRTVLEAVAEEVRRGQPRPARSVQPEHRARADEILDALGVPSDVRTRRERDVTGADLGRARLARLEAQRPAVVVVPGGSAVLDRWHDLAGPQLVDQVLARLREASGTAVVRGDEELPAALEAHERVVVLCGGRVVEVLDPNGLGHPLHPWTRALAAGGEPAMTRPDLTDPGCPFRGRCDRAQARCATHMPELTRPLGASHPVACWFPEHPPRHRTAASPGSGAGSVASPTGAGDEPTAHEFTDG